MMQHPFIKGIYHAPDGKQTVFTTLPLSPLTLLDLQYVIAAAPLTLLVLWSCLVVCPICVCCEQMDQIRRFSFCLLTFSLLLQFRP